MIRLCFRLLGFCFLAAGFVAVIGDGTKSIADRSFYFTTVETIWAQVHQDSLLALQPAIERHAPFLWDPIMRTLLGAPGSLVLGALGAILIVVGRKKKPLIGYARS
jgi:hypothetical protein